MGYQIQQDVDLAVPIPTNALSIDCVTAAFRGQSLSLSTIPTPIIMIRSLVLTTLKEALS